MATTTQNDTSDLLILSDEDTNVDTMVLEDEIVSEEIISDSNDVISFDSDEIVSEEEKNTNHSDLSITEDVFDIGDEETSLKSDDNLSVNEESKELNENLESNFTDLGDFSINTLDDDSETNKVEENSLDINEDISSDITEEIFSLEDATATFITQLDKRKEQISENIKNDEEQISNRDNQISILKSEIADFNKAIKELRYEDTEIDNKIGLVSGNTIANNIKTNTSTKVHNVKRRKAV